MEDFKKFLEENLPKVDLNNGTHIYKVTIEEHVSQTFEVEAADIEEAMEIAEKCYNDGDFVLEPGNVTAKLMMAEADDGSEFTEWREFE